MSFQKYYKGKAFYGLLAVVYTTSFASLASLLSNFRHWIAWVTTAAAILAWGIYIPMVKRNEWKMKMHKVQRTKQVRRGE